MYPLYPPVPPPMSIRSNKRKIQTKYKIIGVFKILKGYDDIGEDIVFVRSKSSLRGHQLKLQKSVRLDIAKYSFSNIEYS